MISSLTIKNIKCFEDQTFQFSPLTVLCGANSAGKSTVIQTLLLLRQSYNDDRFASQEIALMGAYFSAGHLSDLICHNARESQLLIQIDKLSFIVDPSKLDKESYRMRFRCSGEYDHNLFTGDFIYLCAERLGPRNSYDVRFDSNNVNIGIYGEYAMAEFIRRASTSARNQHLARAYTEHARQVGNEDITLEVAVKTVMRRISPGFDINYESHKTVDKVSNAFSSSTTKTSVRPVNTGFGVSYVFPIVVGAFCLTEGSTFIVENPEVHLHPHAQSELAQFLAALSRTGVQVIVETHSDHIINGIRVYAKDHTEASNGIVINSISRQDSAHPIKYITLDTDGNLSDAHEGFFDQAERDLLRLF
jgi:predicted ATPase